ncbi:pheromone autoinducer 2 transporter [Arcanobacterium haemolyticum]|uniref:AI-2E family transporter n=1 Tax=Arcanobacterium haemolyticum TaxID=28264 RepID=UPI000D84439D|nr:AI-2E family transporter [Arcanobacterium haemolyticum]SPT75143.1 pheromone autoinducer 2 transporter [Arcanobacterium haemolyticum]
MKASPTEEHRDNKVPLPLITAAAWAWRLIVVTIVLAGIGWLSFQFYTLIISVMVALLLAVILEPLASGLSKHLRFGSGLAAAIALLTLLAFLSALIWGSSVGIISGVSEVSDQIRAGVSSIVQEVTQRFPNIGAYVNEAWNSLQGTLTTNSGRILGGVVAVGSTVTSLITGFVLVLFTLFFFLKDGRRLWHWMVRLLPLQYQNSANEAGIRAWVMVGNYTKTQAIVALVDAVGIAAIALLLNTPFSLAFPIGVIVFLAAFVPIVGAFVSGFVAVIIVLVNTQSFFMAAMMMLGILVVQQIEGNLLQPVLQGNALNIHPLAIVLIVAGGSSVAGIVGALFIVPIVAAVNAIVLYLRGHDLYPYLNTMEDRPGGAPRDFLELRKEHWEDFAVNVAQNDSPTVQKQTKRAQRKAMIAKVFGTSEKK